MTRKRQSFTPEFKQEAACLVLDQGYTITEATRSLDVGENAHRRWAKQLSEERGGIMPKSKALTPERQRIQELEPRCERLERESSNYACTDFRGWLHLITISVNRYILSLSLILTPLLAFALPIKQSTLGLYHTLYAAPK
jgi:transposase